MRASLRKTNLVSFRNVLTCTIITFNLENRNAEIILQVNSYIKL